MKDSKVNVPTQEEAPRSNEQGEYISGLYSKAKAIYKNAEQTGTTNAASEDELVYIQSEFHAFRDKKGVLFCQKALAIVYEKRGDAAVDEREKINCYEQAHDSINECVMQAQQLKWEQPSLLKRQGIIKSKLGDALHAANDHRNANILEADAFKIFARMLQENPAYAEGHLATAAASLNKVKWSLRKILEELKRAENLFNHPKHTKHTPDAYELNEYKNRIEKMRDSIYYILALPL